MHLSLTAPDDWHCHLRDGSALNSTVNDTAAHFERAIIMPNLVPGITTVALAQQYRDRILAALDPTLTFEPLMTLYLTGDLTPDQISLAHQCPWVYAVKWYPKGATTHSNEGVYDWNSCEATLAAMAECGMPLLIHGEVVNQSVDIFDREAVFLDQCLKPLMQRFPTLNIVLEHISTHAAAEFVEQAPKNIAATITAHHLTFNRNDLFVGGLRPHHYCLPILKRNTDQSALIKAATSGNPKFFLGTDSAPHAHHQKEAACGCAGIYSAPTALAVYAQVFEQHDALDKLEGFASFYGADFYQLPRNTKTIELCKKAWQVPNRLPLGDTHVIPFMAGNTLQWQLDSSSYER